MRHLLTDYNNAKVDAFITYVNALKTETKDGKLTNPWAKSTADNSFVAIFKKEAAKGMYIDGESITIQNRGGKLVVSYDYHAYKNRVIKAYPESTFDFQIVYKGDEFTCKKENGKVEYKHSINNPFDSNKEVIGAYGVIKNKTGEFIELLTPADIDKMKKSSKMSYIWNTWYDRMVLKSVIKRICSSHFHDITKDLDAHDNEINDPNRAGMPSELLDAIDNAETVEQLNKIYHANMHLDIDRNAFLVVIKDRKQELKK